MKSLILSLILIANNAFAGICDLPERVNIGDKVPCTGYLFNDANELKIRTDLAYKTSLIDNLTKQNSIKDDMLKISDQQIQLYKQSQPLNGWERAMWFTIGALATGFAVHEAAQIIR